MGKSQNKKLWPNKGGVIIIIIITCKGGGVWVEDFGRITWFSRCERLFSVN